jgi:hypothetical protein
MTGTSTRLPGKAQSCWVASAAGTSYPRYERSDRTEFAVVGGGIVGLTTACLLARAGRAVTVLEALCVGQQVTGRSTAKITTQHALVYSDLAAASGLERARLYGEANNAGAELIASLVRDLSIRCDYERKDAYAYTLQPERKAALEDEARVAREIGFDVEVLDRAPLPFATAGALRFANQAQFNPAKYLVGLANGVTQAGGRIFENTRVGSVKRRAGGNWRRVGRASPGCGKCRRGDAHPDVDAHSLRSAHARALPYGDGLSRGVRRHDRRHVHRRRPAVAFAAHGARRQGTVADRAGSELSEWKRRRCGSAVRAARALGARQRSGR